MIKVAFNIENPNLVFLIDRVIRIKLNDVQGIVEYYSGVLKDTNPVPDATTEVDYKVQVAGFEMNWQEVPVDLSGATKVNIQPSKTCTPTTYVQNITADTNYTGLGKVVVNAAPTETRTVTPSTTRQTITPSSGKVGLSSVTVNAVTSAIDSDIRPENIKSGVTILGVTGTYTGE